MNFNFLCFSCEGKLIKSLHSTILELADALPNNMILMAYLSRIVFNKSHLPVIACTSDSLIILRNIVWLTYFMFAHLTTL